MRELFCGSKITRNDSDEAERRERSPPGVVSVANVEGLAGAARQVSGKAAPANGSASQVNGSSEASGEVRTGDRARRRRAGLEKALRSHPQTTGTQFVTGNDTERQIKLMYHDTVMCDWKADGMRPAGKHGF